MDGKSGKAKIKKCPLCGGVMSDNITTMPFMIADKVAIIKDVPAEVCSDCGESYAKSSVVDRIEAVLEELESLHSEVSIVHYEAA